MRFGLFCPHIAIIIQNVFLYEYQNTIQIPTNSISEESLKIILDSKLRLLEKEIADLVRSSSSVLSTTSY